MDNGKSSAGIVSRPMKPGDLVIMGPGIQAHHRLSWTDIEDVTCINFDLFRTALRNKDADEIFNTMAYLSPVQAAVPAVFLHTFNIAEFFNDHGVFEDEEGRSTGDDEITYQNWAASAVIPDCIVLHKGIRYLFPQKYLTLYEKDV